MLASISHMDQSAPSALTPFKKMEEPRGDSHHRRKASLRGWRRYFTSLVAAEISSLTRYMDHVIVTAHQHDSATALLEEIDAPSKQAVKDISDVPTALQDAPEYTTVILDGTFNHTDDIQATLENLGNSLHRSGRVVSIMYNPYYRWLYQIATYLGFRQGPLPSTFVTRADLTNVAKLSRFEITRVRPIGIVPLHLWGLGTLLNRTLSTIPGIRLLCVSWLVVLRPIQTVRVRPTLSIVIPARNERGNIEASISRIPDVGTNIEVVFVEGHSDDGTWEEIQRISSVFNHKCAIKCLRQSGRGKADAVRLGLEHCSGDLCVILDADLSTPPELLNRFYDAWCQGLADFVNGNRLVYTMESGAMRFLNKVGNVFFAKALSFALDTSLGDTLCGTKLFSRRDYQRMTTWRSDFGDFDPFGDFELLFPAAQLSLGVINVPLKYRDRVYGQTNIRRFRDGYQLLRMTITGLLRIKLGAPPRM